MTGDGWNSRENPSTDTAPVIDPPNASQIQTGAEVLQRGQGFGEKRKRIANTPYDPEAVF